MTKLHNLYFANLLPFLWCCSKNKLKLFPLNASAYLASISINMIGERHIWHWISHKHLSTFPCGREQHVRCIPSSISSVINYILKFSYTFLLLLSDLTRDSSNILVNASFPFFSTKIATETVHTCIIFLNLSWLNSRLYNYIYINFFFAWVKLKMKAHCFYLATCLAKRFYLAKTFLC